MKKIFCYIMVLMLTINYVLISQNSQEYFITFTEEMQYNNMEASINWFRKNKYDFNKHKVDENVFTFYRGVARFSSYQIYHGPPSDLKLAIQDFYKVLMSETSYNDYYSDRSLLYIAIALMEFEDDREVAARMLQYFVDNTAITHPYYTTALFWETYFKFLNSSTYTSNYDTLLELSKNKSILIYDYSTASTRNLFQVMNKLTKPSRVTLRQYKWTRDSTDIMTLITTTVVNENIYDNPNTPNVIPKPTVIKPTVTPTPKGLPKPTAIPKPTVLPTPTAIPTPKKDDTSSSSLPKNLNASNMDGFRLIVEKNDDNIPLRIQIAGKTIITRKSKKYTVYINAGEYNIISTYNKKSYTNVMNVSSEKINILTIIAKSPTSEESYVRFLISLDGIKKENNSRNPIATKSLNNKTTDTVKNLLIQDPSLAIKWFNINYYRNSMNMTSEKYAYYRGLAYYKQFLVDRNPSYAAQAKSDLEFVYNNKDTNVDTLINTEIYLANIEAYAYGNYKDAERFLVSATKRINDEFDNQYLPTIAYWRVRIGVADSREISRLRKILISKPKTTAILDMKTGNYQILSIMYPKIDAKISILPASSVTAKAFLSPPSKNDELLKSSSELRNIPIHIDIAGKMENATIQFTSINDNRHQIPYEDKLFIGKNKLTISLDDQIFYIDINTNKNEAYSILIVPN